MTETRAKGWIVNEAIVSHVALEERRRHLTLEALADVKAGRTRDHADIEAWASTLGTAKRSTRR